MVELHGGLGPAVLAVTLLLALGAILVRVAGQRPIGRRVAPVVDVLWLIVVGATGLAFVIGPLLLATGRVLVDGLHALYGLAALVSLPLATVVGVLRSPGRGHHPSRYGWVAGGALITAALALRLIQTG